MGNADAASASTDADARGEPAGEEAATELGERWALGNWVLIGVFTVLTLVGVGLSMEVPPFDGWLTAGDGAVVVPPYVYVYASLGAFGYVFTRLMTNLEAFDEWDEFQELAEMALRVPAAWVLAAGAFLLFTTVVGSPEGVSGQRYTAGLAFLVGLYVNVAMKSLGSLADRLLGRTAPGK
ncbi:hypothetical protein [Halorientalis halophila]|uniref:hypothetical protein n=1 Tax=Halorientalis halophila TaxID=3108499 RepID=UPI003008635B